MFEKSTDALAEWREYRDKVAEHCHGRWEDACDLFPEMSVKNRFYEGKRNETCPECDRKEKLFIVDTHTFAAHCASERCSKHYFDGIALIAALTKLSHKEVVNRIAAHFNLYKKNILPSQSVSYAHKRNPKQSQLKTIQAPQQTAGCLSRESIYLDRMKQSIENTPAELYLRKRGLDVDKLDTSEFFYVQRARHYVDDEESDTSTFTEHPALIARVKSPKGEHVGFSIIFLTEDGDKADVKTQKRLSSAHHDGAYTGSYVDTVKSINGVLGIAEGKETTLALNQYGIPVRSVLTANGIRNFVVPDGVHTLLFFGDLDASGVGEKMIIEKHYELLETHPHLKVKLFLPPEEVVTADDIKGIDFLDVHVRTPNIMQKMSSRFGNFV